VLYGWSDGGVQRGRRRIWRIWLDRSITTTSRTASPKPACLPCGSCSPFQPSRTARRHHHGSRQVQIGAPGSRRGGPSAQTDSAQKSERSIQDAASRSRSRLRLVGLFIRPFSCLTWLRYELAV